MVRYQLKGIGRSYQVLIRCLQETKYSRYLPTFNFLRAKWEAKTQNDIPKHTWKRRGFQLEHRKFWNFTLWIGLQRKINISWTHLELSLAYNLACNLFTGAEATLLAFYPSQITTSSIEMSYLNSDSWPQCWQQRIGPQLFVLIVALHEVPLWE